MDEVKNINGITVESGGGKRVVRYQGNVCPLIKDREVVCEQDTSYNGDILDSWETYATPVGVVERHYWARGAGLERSGVDWRIIPVEEIAAAQERFRKASIELAEAREALEALTPP